MLELQQQLAVAVSTDRKKETMIEHLDKVKGSFCGDLRVIVNYKTSRLLVAII